MFLAWIRRWCGRAPQPQALQRLRQQAAAMPLLQGLSADENEQLLAIAANLLRDKSFTGQEEMQLEQTMADVLALQMALPVLHLGPSALDNWREVVLYPAPFVARDRWTDGIGLAHESERVLIGQARYTGPLVLSWPDVAESPLLDGWNVVIHEIAHQLDMLNGDANGAPPLHKGMNQAVWSQAWGQAYRQFCRQVDVGVHHWLDPYAAESPAEFFAVISEAFFEIPHSVRRDYPAVYQQLQLFYRQDPAQRLPEFLVDAGDDDGVQLMS